MNVKLSYLGNSQLVTGSHGDRILQFAPNLDRDKVAFDAPLKHPLHFREAISSLHDIVINDLTFQPRDKTAYENWKKQQLLNEKAIRERGKAQARKELEAAKGTKPSKELKHSHSLALKRYWQARREMNTYLQKTNEELWRKLMPYDPVITVADNVLFFECFSRDESSYGCLTVDRDECFGYSSQESLGTTNVDYSWDLYNNFQSLRTYRETRFNIDPSGFQVRTSDQEDYHEEKIDLPNGWLRGFMQLQSAMCLPMRKVRLSVGAVYNLLAFLKRNKAKTSPRAIRFELADGENPTLVLEPWEKKIVSHGTRYSGIHDEPIRVWGRRRLLTLARLLPLAEYADVFLLGTGLPSFWSVKMGSMRLLLGLSGWTANDWTRGSAVEMLMPQKNPEEQLVAKVADLLNRRREMTLDDISNSTFSDHANSAACLNQLALRGQVIFDLSDQVFRWRQILPVALSDKEFGEPHPELVGAKSLALKRAFEIRSCESGPRGGFIVVGKVEGKPCETLIDGDGLVRRGKCLCGWHKKFGIRNGPCRHIQVLRNVALKTYGEGGDDNWFSKRMKWAGFG